MGLPQAITPPTQLSRKPLWSIFNIRSPCFVCPARQAESYALQQLKVVKLSVQVWKSCFNSIRSEKVILDTFSLVTFT
jgi:hypothetical protein